MEALAGATFNLHHKLRARELTAARPGASTHRSRRFYESVFPTETVRPRRWAKFPAHRPRRAGDRELVDLGVHLGVEEHRCELVDVDAATLARAGLNTPAADALEGAPFQSNLAAGPLPFHGGPAVRGVRREIGVGRQHALEVRGRTYFPWEQCGRRRAGREEDPGAGAVAARDRVR